MIPTVRKEDIHTRTKTVYYLYCPHCGIEIDDDDAGFPSAGDEWAINCPDCGKEFYIEG